MFAIKKFLSENAQFTKNISICSGSIICTEGQICTDLVVVISGVVRVYKPSVDGRSISLYHISSGQSCILTAGCILNNEQFPAIAEAKTDVKGIAISAARVSHWMDDSTVWRNYIFSILSSRFIDVIKLADSLAFQQLDVRLGTWLSRHESGKNEILSTHQEIAEELASSREVISRLLKSFEKQGLICLSRGKIKILNKKRLLNG